MRVNRFTLAMTVCAGLALLAGRAFAGGPVSDLLEGDFVIDASDANDPNSNLCEVFAIGDEFAVGGTVRGVGTGGEAVSVDYTTLTPTSASRNPNKVNAKQSTFSQLTFHFAAVNVGPTLVQKCSVSGAVNPNKSSNSGSVSADCKGTDVFALLSANQAASLITAFQNNKNVKVKVNGSSNKGSITVKCKGDAVDID